MTGLFTTLANLVRPPAQPTTEPSDQETQGRVKLKIGKPLAAIHEALTGSHKFTGEGVLSRRMRNRMTSVAVTLSRLAKNNVESGEARRIILRTVLRSNYFWTYSDTEELTPLRLPFQPSRYEVGLLERHVYWLAEQEAQVGRAVPDSDYVDTVRSCFQAFLVRAQDASQVMELAHLAFLCKFEEEQLVQPVGITVGDMRERIGLAFPHMSAEDWGVLQIFKPLEVGQEYVTRMGEELVELEKIWAVVQPKIAPVSSETQKPGDASTNAEIPHVEVTPAT
ncbi:hypothetical protein LTR56_007270 [Elasticomyces elasticus]|nr:hypothetical protein LTR56_007270 [Elasticomyces elasticus]KAK3662997.1 hypothetical protein LTR22_006161 [Elasticomyces elasticus]KAK4918886.1 hypothetical protein LTR49_013358 [Elasticomyces elasticus]KAK5740748.1 hypothetical protein LTS12_024839 [Elasticomyces elasticus]